MALFVLLFFYLLPCLLALGWVASFVRIIIYFLQKRALSITFRPAFIGALIILFFASYGWIHTFGQEMIPEWTQKWKAPAFQISLPNNYKGFFVLRFIDCSNPCTQTTWKSGDKIIIGTSGIADISIDDSTNGLLSAATYYVGTNKIYPFGSSSFSGKTSSYFYLPDPATNNEFMEKRIWVHEDDVIDESLKTGVPVNVVYRKRLKEAKEPE